MSAQFHMDPETYLDAIRAEVPRYDELQEATIEAIPFAPEAGAGARHRDRRDHAPPAGALPRTPR